MYASPRNDLDTRSNSAMFVHENPVQSRHQTPIQKFYNTGKEFQHQLLVGNSSR